MVMGAPLEDARDLAQWYGRMRQEAKAQTIEVSKRQAKVRENPGNPETLVKLESAEAKLQDLKLNMTILGKEAASAMAVVEDQQQNQTLQRLITLVEAERSYHQKILEIIERLEGEMRFEQHRIEAPQTLHVENITSSPPPSYEEANDEVNASQMHNGTSDAMGYFVGEVMFPYQSDSDVELSLSVGDYSGFFWWVLVILLDTRVKLRGMGEIKWTTKYPERKIINSLSIYW